MVDVPPLEHQGPKVGRIRQGKGHRAEVVFGRAGHRVGAGLLQPDHRVGESEEEGDMVVGREGAAPIVVGRNGYRRLLMAGDRVNAGASGPLETGVGPSGDGV